MLWLSVLVTGLATRASAAWMFPSDMEDGMYSVTLPDTSETDTQPPASPKLLRRAEVRPNLERPWSPGPPSRERLEAVPLPNPPKREPKDDWPDMVPIPVSHWYCRHGAYGMSRAAYEQARVSFSRYCEDFLVPPKTIHLDVSRNGTLAVFMCNFSKRNQVCSGREFEWLEANWFDMFCGHAKPAQVEISKWAKAYGRAYPGESLCRRNFRLYEKLREDVYFGGT